MDTLTAISGRRAINFFDPEKTIPEETLRKLMTLAGLAPSSFNLQPWEVIVVKDPLRKKTLRRCAYNQAKVEEASLTLIIIANPDAAEKNLDEVLTSRIRQGYMRQEDREKTRSAYLTKYGERDSEARRIFAVKNTSFFAMNLMLAARGLGLETHPMDGFKSDEVKKEFNIPQNRVIPLLIAVGYPAKDISMLERPARRDVDAYVMIDNYDKV